MELSEPWFSGILPDAGWGKTNVTIKTDIKKKNGHYYVFPSVLTLFHALKWSRKSSKDLLFKCHYSDAPGGRMSLGSFRCFSIAVKMALIDSFGAKPPRPAENKIITQDLIFSSQPLWEVFFLMRETVCCHACSNPRNGQSCGRFGLAEVQNRSQRWMWCLRRCPAQPSVR